MKNMSGLWYQLLSRFYTSLADPQVIQRRGNSHKVLKTALWKPQSRKRRCFLSYIADA